MESVAQRFRPKPLVVGNVTVDPPLILAPMAGVTDEAFRKVMADFGAGLVTTEMVSAEGLRRDQRSTWRLCAQDAPIPAPLAVQLFGRDPEVVAEAARRVEGRGVSLIDINAGCPVRKVVRQGAGASLLKDPDRLAWMVESVKRAVRLPVTVKIRLGWDTHSISVVELAQRLSAAGVDGLSIHARTAVQHYSGSADWNWISKVKEVVDIPVIGNGDVTSAAAAEALLQQTGCDGVMIGRASLGNPWIFAVIAERWGHSGRLGATVGWMDFYETVQAHLDAFAAKKSKPAGHFRKLLMWYSKGCPEASRLRAELFVLDQPAGMLRAFHSWLQELAARGIPFLPLKAPEAGG